MPATANRKRLDSVAGKKTADAIEKEIKRELDQLVSVVFTSRRKTGLVDLGKEAGYLDTNTARMRYPEFRRQHLFVGSGVMEAGCKTVIGSRCKQSGMFWTVRGANAILALRCCHINGQFEDYWESRAA